MLRIAVGILAILAYVHSLFWFYDPQSNGLLPLDTLRSYKGPPIVGTLLENERLRSIGGIIACLVLVSFVYAGIYGLLIFIPDSAGAFNEDGEWRSLRYSFSAALLLPIGWVFNAIHARCSFNQSVVDKIISKQKINPADDRAKILKAVDLIPEIQTL